MTIHDINSTTVINNVTYHTIGETIINGNNSITNTETYANGIEISKGQYTSSIENGVDSWTSTIIEEPNGQVIKSHGSFNI